jgi:hypothetical protein
MNKRGFVPCLFLMLFLVGTLYTLNTTNVRAAASFAGPKTLVLYDVASGGIPSETLMDFTDFPPGAASLTYSDGATVMDTSPSGMETFAGWVSGQAITPEFPVLNRTVGVQVNFTLQVESESHTNNNRAGLSVIILDQEAKGIELAFWENEIWAQNDDRMGNLFTHGEGIAFATTGLTEYQVSIVGDTYTLTGNSEQILTGPVRDYSAFDGFPDPYETPSFLFWGDDTTTADARAKLRFASVTGTEPVLPAAMMTDTSTSSPLPAASFTPPPSVTPAPSPTAASPGRILDLCSSGWLFFAVTITSLVMSKKVR